MKTALFCYITVTEKVNRAMLQINLYPILIHWTAIYPLEITSSTSEQLTSGLYFSQMTAAAWWYSLSPLIFNATFFFNKCFHLFSNFITPPCHGYMEGIITANCKSMEPPLVLKASNNLSLEVAHFLLQFMPFTASKATDSKIKIVVTVTSFGTAYILSILLMKKYNFNVQCTLYTTLY